MTNILLVTYQHIGIGLLNAAQHVLGETVGNVKVLEINDKLTAEQMNDMFKGILSSAKNDTLILVDLYGATHANIASKYIQHGHIELISGVNLPMLLRAFNYHDLPINQLTNKLMTLSQEGIVHLSDNNKIDSKNIL